MSRIAQFWAAVALLAPISVLAASTESYQSSPGVGGGFFIVWGIAYLSRRRAIGGWLLIFYLQLYLSALISVLFVPLLISALQPSRWDNTEIYVIFLLSIVPYSIVQFVQLVAATLLLVRRSETNLNFLRHVQTALVVLNFISIAIVFICFFTVNPERAIGLVVVGAFLLPFAICWSMYFRGSKRVRAVFIDKNWAYQPKPLAAEDKKTRRDA